MKQKKKVILINPIQIPHPYGSSYHIKKNQAAKILSTEAISPSIGCTLSVRVEIRTSVWILAIPCPWISAWAQPISCVT
jgi:hypothetical protein